MHRIYFVRHGETVWNVENKIAVKLLVDPQNTVFHGNPSFVPFIIRRRRFAVNRSA